MPRNYSEYEIVIDLNQELSLDSLSGGLPPLDPLSLPSFDYTADGPVTERGLIGQWQLEQDYELNFEQDTPMLSNFYEDENEIRARRAKREADKEREGSRVKREPLYLEPRKERSSSSRSEWDHSSSTANDDAQSATEIPTERSQQEKKNETNGTHGDAAVQGKELSENPRHTEELKLEGDGESPDQKDTDQQCAKEAESQDKQQKEESTEKCHSAEEADNQTASNANIEAKKDKKQPKQDQDPDLPYKEEDALEQVQEQEQQSQHQEAQDSEDEEQKRKVQMEHTRATNKSRNLLEASGVWNERKSLLFVMTNDNGRYTINLDTIVGFNGSRLYWGGSGFARFARRVSAGPRQLFAECRVGRRWTWISLDDVYQHIWYDKDQRQLRFSLEAIDWTE